MITWHDHEQMSPAWYSARLGLLTASRMRAAVGTGKGRQDLIDKLIAEVITGQPDTIPTTKAMQDGIDREPLARADFEFITDLDVREVGLATNDDLPGLGASLDGLIDSTTGLEIKCPKPSTLVRYHRVGKLPVEYACQIMGQMLVCELNTVHFFAWHPDCPPFHVLVRDEDVDMMGFSARVGAFLTDYTSQLQETRGKL